MNKVLVAVIAYAAMLAQADAAMITTTIDDWKANPVQIGDKLFTYLDGADNFNNAKLVFSSHAFPDQTVYDMDVFFVPSLIGTVIDLNYSVQVTDPGMHISGLGLDSLIGALGTDFNLTKTYYSDSRHLNQVAELVSVNGSNTSVLGDFGKVIYTHVHGTVPSTNDLKSFHDGYSQAPDTTPEPSSIALLACGGLGLAFGGWRRRTRRADLAA
jgi:hypothetical protein